MAAKAAATCRWHSKLAIGSWSHSVVEHLLCEVMCLGVRDGAAETLLTGVKVVPETMYLGKSSIGGDIAHIGDYLCLFVFMC